MGLFATSLSSVRKVFSDTFNRINGSLGTASDGTKWEDIRPGFEIVSNKASANNPAQYPLAAVNFPSSDVSVSISGATQGASAALWVTDSGNWWAVGIDQAPVQCNCQTGSNCDAWNTINCSTWGFNGGSCASTYTNLGPCIAWNTITNGCIAWSRTGGACDTWSRSGGNCRTSGGGNCRANSGGNCRANSGGGCSRATERCTRWGSMGVCNAYQVTCVAWTSIVCNAWNTITCNAWNTINCNAWNTITSSCNGWSTINTPCNGWTQTGGGNCAARGSGNTVCDGWNTITNFCTGTTGGNCAQFTTFQFNCQTCYPQYIRLIQSVSATVSEVFSWTVSSIVKSFRVKTKKDQITIELYSDDNHTTKIGSDIIYTPTGVAVNPKFGIMLKPSAYNQENTIDGIEITRN